MALLHGAACIVAGDTGPLHLAAAVGTSTVALFGPTDPARNGPYRADKIQTSPPKDIVLRASGVRTTHERLTQPHPSMLALSGDQVFEAVRRAIGVTA
jgi:heptosyltransferase-1